MSKFWYMISQVFSIDLPPLLLIPDITSHHQLLLTRIGDTQVRICRHVSISPGGTMKYNILQNRLTTLTNTNRKWGGTRAKFMTCVGMKTPQLRMRVGT